MGMVRQWQELLHGSRYSESYSQALPDFVKLAEAFHATGLRATEIGELDDVIARMLATDGPVIAAHAAATSPSERRTSEASASEVEPVSAPGCS